MHDWICVEHTEGRGHPTPLQCRTRSLLNPPPTMRLIDSNSLGSVVSGPTVSFRLGANGPLRDPAFRGSQPGHSAQRPPTTSYINQLGDEQEEPHHIATSNEKDELYYFSICTAQDKPSGLRDCCITSLKICLSRGARRQAGRPIKALLYTPVHPTSSLSQTFPPLLCFQNPSTCNPTLSSVVRRTAGWSESSAGPEKKQVSGLHPCTCMTKVSSFSIHPSAISHTFYNTAPAPLLSAQPVNVDPFIRSLQRSRILTSTGRW
jgi:hypothetical protein